MRLSDFLARPSALGGMLKQQILLRIKCVCESREFSLMFCGAWFFIIILCYGISGLIYGHLKILNVRHLEYSNRHFSMLYTFKYKNIAFSAFSHLGRPTLIQMSLVPTSTCTTAIHLGLHLRGGDETIWPAEQCDS